MIAGRRWVHVLALAALGGAPGCADLLGADFDVHRTSNRSDAAPDADRGKGSNPAFPDGGARDAAAGTSATDATYDDSRSDVGVDAYVPGSDGGRDVEYDDHPTDASDVGERPDGGGPSDAADSAVGDTGDTGNTSDPPDGGVSTDVITEPPPDGPRTTGLVGSFVSLGVPSSVPSTIELHGQFISNTVIRSVTSTGITIEGKIQ
jgi:hypothetical protein